MRSCTHKVFSFTESWQKESKMTKRSSKQLTHRKLRAENFNSERNLNLNRKCWEVALICTCAHLCLSLSHTHMHVCTFSVELISAALPRSVSVSSSGFTHQVLLQLPENLLSNQQPLLQWHHFLFFFSTIMCVRCHH